MKATTPVMVAIGNPPYRERAKGLGGWVESGNPDAQQQAILDGPQITVEDLNAAEVLPVPAEAKKAPKVERKAAPAQTTLV